MNLRKIIVDGLQVETTEAGEAAINKLQGQLTTADASVVTARADADRSIAAKDAELAARDAEIADLKTKVIDTATLDSKVAARAELVGRAVALVPAFDAKGKTDAEIKRGVVQIKCGDAAVTDKSDVYVDARFDTLVEALPAGSVGPDPIRDAVMQTHGNVHSINPADAARAADAALAEANDLNGWRNKA